MKTTPFLLRLPLLLSLLMAGCALPIKEAAAPAKHEEQTESTATRPVEVDTETENLNLPNLALSPELLYQLLLAEIAGQRGKLGDSAELYRHLSLSTRDPRIVRRGAELALHARRIDVALELTRLWLEIEPASQRARQTLAGLLAAQGNIAELQQHVTILLASEPKELAQNLLHLNRMFSRGGDRALVRRVIDAVTEPYLQLPEAHYARALAAFEAQDRTVAKVSILRALDLRPGWEAAALLHVQLIEERDEAIAVLSGYVAKHPEWHDMRLAHARALVGAKRYEEARQAFGVLLKQGERDPARHGDIIFAVAVLSLQLGDTRDAEVQLRKLIDIDHGEADKARFYLGQIADEGKRSEEALQWFSQVGRGEHYLTARLRAANILVKQGKPDEAHAFLAATETTTPRERTQLLLGEAQLLRDAGRPANAHAALVAGLAQQPDNPELIYEIALLAERLGRPDELETRLRHLLVLQPDHAHALNALGYSLADRNVRLPEARELIERALALAPNDPFIMDSKGWVMFRQGEKEAALAVLNQAFSLRADPEIAAHIGEVLWVLGRQAEARETWTKALQEHPGNSVLAETIKRFQP